jgi:hypothetical protein
LNVPNISGLILDLREDKFYNIEKYYKTQGFVLYAAYIPFVWRKVGEDDKPI